jgi:hypothetical protein
LDKGLALFFAHDVEAQNERADGAREGGEDDDEVEDDEEEDDEEDKKRARIRSRSRSDQIEIRSDRARIRSHTGADSASSAAATTAAIAFAPPSWDIRWRTSAALSAATEASDRMPEGRCDLFKGGWRTNGLGAEMARLL